MPRARFQDLLDSGGDRVRHHLEIPELHFEGRQFDRRVLLRSGRQQLSAGGHRHQDGPHRPQYQEHHRVQGHLGRSCREYLPRPGENPAERRGRAQFHPMRFAADGSEVRGAHVSLYGSQESDRDGGTRGQHLQNRRGPTVLLLAARHLGGRRRQHDRQRILQSGVQGTADGVRGRGTEPVERESGRRRRLTARRKGIRGKILLTITDLSARVAGKDILKGVNLEVRAGEVHAIMGPNGSGKSTLAQVLAGREDYEVTGGSVTFDGRDLLALPPEERARAGLFLGFQYPVEIPGVNNVYLLKAALNAKRKAAGEPEVDAYEFLTLIRHKMKFMQMSESFLTRGVNEGFSGGEKKRNEVLQMLVLEPRLAILDETDSGLDIDALKVVSTGVNTLRDSKRAIVLVTHYQRLLDYIVPDRVHVLSGGRILKSGDRSLAHELERRGYDWVLGAQVA